MMTTSSQCTVWRDAVCVRADVSDRGSAEGATKAVAECDSPQAPPTLPRGLRAHFLIQLTISIIFRSPELAAQMTAA